MCVCVYIYNYVNVLLDTVKVTYW